MNELLNEVIKHYKDMQQLEPDNLSLPKFHEAMQRLIEQQESVPAETPVRQGEVQPVLLADIEEIIASYCDGTMNKEGILHGAHFIEWFGEEKTNKAPQECANRIYKLIESKQSA
jgi:hypothetical protein